MAKAQLPQALTANRLATGNVVYWHDGGWTENFTEAQIFATADLAKGALDAAQRFVAKRIIVNPYFFPVRADGQDAHPIEEREIIRAAGPSVRRDLGKQSNHLPVGRSANEVSRVGGGA